ncbi:MAG: ABC transporter ATP-binding protein [Pseudomonadota bacterium]
MSATEILTVRQLHTELSRPDQPPVRAVDGISLTLHRGKTFALLGESGCGKSMAALSVLRLLPPNGCITQGDVRLDGKSVLALPEAAMRQVRGRRISMIFQEPMSSLNPVMTVGNQVAEVVKLHDPTATPRERVLELFKAVGIPDPVRRWGEFPHQLSGGLQQRMMIALALAGRPDVLIADEPTTALDVTIQAQVLNLLRQLQQETGMAILLITHDLGVAAQMADQVAVMYAGQIVEQAPAADFFRQQQHPYSRKLLLSLPNAHKRRQTLAVIPGMVPALDQPFSGCRFADRCDLAQDTCHQSLPPWHHTNQHTQAGFLCHLPANTPDSPTSSATATSDAYAESTAPLLQVRDLRLHFPIRTGVLRRVTGHVKAVDGVNLTLAAGQTLALVGESGCGKTTVGKTLLQLYRATAGQIRFDGRDISSLNGRARRRLGAELQMIFQDPASSMNPRLRVADIIAEGLRAQQIGRTQAERQSRVTELLHQVGLPASAMARYPHEFSGGQRQRIAIARALAVSPRLIVCDEPTSALDVSVQAQILNLLKNLQHTLGLSYLFITHNIAVVSFLADQVAVMYLGRIVEQGPVASLLNQPRHPYTQALLAAVPSPEPDSSQTEDHTPITGDLPSPANPPTGCHFHTRCPQASAQCRTAYPPVLQLAEQHTVACWLYQNGDSTR